MTDHPSHTGLLVVISGPSGVGKTSITHAVIDQLNAVFSVSCTTRPARPREQDGVDYRFISDEEFCRRLDSGEFLEHARVFDRFYGTPRGPVEEQLQSGRIVLLEIDVQGAIQIRQSMPEAFLIFVLPPGEVALLERLRARSSEGEDEIQKRFREAREEIRLARESGVYDLFVINDDLDVAIHDVIAAIRARRAR